LPALDLSNGKILLEDKNKVFEAPNGNGGIYKALYDSGMMEKMQND